MAQWLSKVFNLFKPDDDNDGGRDPRILTARQHGLHSHQISSAAVKTVDRLQDAGFEAYAVGGCVRDLLLDDKPKDFDVSTNATPEQVRKLFRNSRIIGRRFRIVHVRFGREIIEVTTFRSHHTESEDAKEASQGDSGVLLRDNVYGGDLQADAVRRDFTVNALYYCPTDNTVHDYTGGLRDLKNRQIRMIGDPETRYREDPVRMLRAARFAAKLDFDIEPETAHPLRPLAYLLDQTAPARLFDEILKLLAGGAGLRTYEVLQEFQLIEHLFPVTTPLLPRGNQYEQESGDYFERFIRQSLKNTDTRLAQGKRITPAFLYAALLWPPLKVDLDRRIAKGSEPSLALHKAANQVLDQQIKRVAIPRRFTSTMREIWELQLRLPKRGGSKAFRVMEHPKFRAAYDFLLLRAEVGEPGSNENLNELGKWWTDFQAVSEHQQKKMVDDLFAKSTKKNESKRKPRRRSRKKSDSNDLSNNSATPPVNNQANQSQDSAN
ncbi:MAG: polynucleotide adenylyltransferase PcnB [Cellvibrionaceae bacterium]